MTLIAFEGCIGAGKTSLVNYFSHELGCGKILEDYASNPFLAEFYKGSTVQFETELSFLLIHFFQLKNAFTESSHNLLLLDFSIEKDMVYAKLNLPPEELRLFMAVYDHVVSNVGLPDVVIYLDLSLKILRRRIFQRGRPYELAADPEYFKEFNDRIRDYFTCESACKTYVTNADDLELDPDNKKLCSIRDIIQDEMVREQ